MKREGEIRNERGEIYLVRRLFRIITHDIRQGAFEGWYMHLLHSFSIGKIKLFFLHENDTNKINKYELFSFVLWNRK